MFVMIIIAFFKTINFLSNSIKTVFQACRSRYHRHRSSSSSSSSSSAGSFVFDHLDDQFERSIEYFMMTVLESDQQQENHQMYFIPPGCINIEQLDSISPKHLFVSKIVGSEENDNNESIGKNENNNNSDNDNEKDEKDKQLKQEKNKKSLETVVNSSSSSSSSNTENSQLDDEKQKQKQQQISPDDIDLEKGHLELENLQTKYESYGTDSVCAICQESLKINVEEEQEKEEAQEQEQGQEEEQENDDSDAKTIQKSIENPINDNNIPKQKGERQTPNTGVVRTLPCNHTFHSKCITIWVTRRRGCCPLCNRDLQKYFPTES